MAVTWGILSTAGINRGVIPAAQASELVELRAVASRDADRAERYAREWGIERAYGSYESLLADPDVEAVYIPLPNSLHVDWTLQALAAGKHVLCEKPLTRSAGEAERVFDAAEDADLLVMEGFMWRHHPQTRRAAELAAEGALGEVRLVRSSFSFPLTDLGDIRMQDDLAGGALMDLGCYCVSASRLFCGEPDSVSAQEVRSRGGVDVRFAGALRFGSGALAVFDCAFDLPRRGDLEIVGSDGVLRVADPWILTEPGLALERGGRVERIEVPRADKFRLELENLSRAIRGEEEPLLGRSDAVGQARTLERLYADAGDRV